VWKLGVIREYAEAKGISDIMLSVETARKLKEYADAKGISNMLLSVVTGRIKKSMQMQMGCQTHC
jgi:hypothetical protein